MSYFVLVYDRPEQRLVELREFAADDRAAADAFRLTAQRQALRNDLDQEIVLFQAGSREALEQTHGSYFFSTRELLARAGEAARAS